MQHLTKCGQPLPIVQGGCLTPFTCPKKEMNYCSKPIMGVQHSTVVLPPTDEMQSDAANECPCDDPVM